MIRTGIETLYSDLHTLKAFTLDMNDLRHRLDTIESQFRDWRERWLIVSEDSVESHQCADLYQFLWGDKGYDEIRQQLLHLNTRLEEASKELGRYVELQKQAGPMSWLRKQRYKVVYIATRAKRIEKLITTKLEGSIGDISKKSDEMWLDCWNKNHPGRFVEEIDLTEVRHSAICYLLVSLSTSEATHKNLDELGRSFETMKNEQIAELELDFFGTGSLGRDRATNRLPNATASGHGEKPVSPVIQYITQIILSRPLRFFVLTKPLSNQDSDANMTLHQVVPRTDANDIPSRLMEAHEAFKRSCEGVSCHFDTAESMFSVCRPQRFRTPNAHPGRLSFWERRPMLDPRSRYRAAFELAQACLLFMKSTWFSQFCGCELKYGWLRHTARSNFEFALRLGASRTALSDEQPRRHCHAERNKSDALNLNNPTRSIRQLALILIEIEVQVDVREVTWENDDLSGNPARLRRLVVHPALNDFSTEQEVLRSTRWNEKYYRPALEWCLKEKVSNDINEKKYERCLAEFYNKVVKR